MLINYNSCETAFSTSTVSFEVTNLVSVLPLETVTGDPNTPCLKTMKIVPVQKNMQRSFQVLLNMVIDIYLLLHVYVDP